MVGGVLTITCVDHLSHFPETLRRALAQLAVEPGDSLEKVGKVLPTMSPHLKTLPGMSRLHDDWVIDRSIYPGSIIPLVNFPEALALVLRVLRCLAALRDRLALVQGHRWRGLGVQHSGDRAVLGERAQHARLPRHSPPRDLQANQRLYDLCTSARRQLELFEVKGARHLAQFRAAWRDCRGCPDLLGDRRCAGG